MATSRTSECYASMDAGCHYTRDDTALHQTSSLQDLVEWPMRRHSWTAFDNIAFVGSQMDLENFVITRKERGSELKSQAAGFTKGMLVKDLFIPPPDNRTAYVRAIREPPDGDWGWLVVLCSVVLTTMSAGILSCYGLFLPAAIGSRTLGQHCASIWLWVAAAAFALHNLSHPAWTFLCYRTASRKVAVFGSVFFSVVLLLSYLKSSSIWIYPLLVLAGLGTSACCASSINSVERYFSSRVHTARSLSQSGWALGLLLWPQVWDVSFQPGEVPWNFITLVTIGAISLVAAFQFRPAAPHYKTFYIIQATPSEHAVAHKQPDTAIHRPSRYVFMMVAAVVNVARMSVLFKLPGNMLSVRLNKGDVTAVFCFCGIAEIVGRLFGGWMQDFGFPPTFQCWFCAGLLLGGSIVATALCSHYETIVACATGMGLAWGLWTALSYVPAEHKQQKCLDGIGLLLQALLSAVAPFMEDSSFSADWISFPIIFLFGAIIILSSVVAIIAQIILNCQKGEDTA